MFDFLPAGAGDWTAAGLLAVVVIMILTDRLVTKGRLDESREQAKLWQQHATNQQTINQTHAETARENSQSVKHLTEAALLQEKVMNAVQEHHRLREGGQQ